MLSKCLQCGKAVVTSPARAQSGRGRFCSRVCAGRYATGPGSRRFIHGRFVRTEHRCPKCGKVFFAKAKQRFCSVACARRPRTLLECEQCHLPFYAGRLKARFCSWECRVEAQRVKERKPRPRPSPEARYAQSRVSYLVSSGKLTRPDRCEECGGQGRIEAAHYNYAEPERVRWLCCSFPRKWDWASPKNGTLPDEGVAPEKSPAPAGA